MNVPHTFFPRHKEFNYSSLFVTCVRHRRHFNILLQRRYLSDDRVFIQVCALNISVATSQFSHCYLYSRIKKKYGALLSEKPSYFCILTCDRHPFPLPLNAVWVSELLNLAQHLKCDMAQQRFPLFWIHVKLLVAVLIHFYEFFLWILRLSVIWSYIFHLVRVWFISVLHRT